MSKTFKTLLKENLWMIDEVMDFMISHYYNEDSKRKQKAHVKGYTKVWHDLLKMRTKKSTFQIAIRHVVDDISESEWEDVHGIHPDDPSETWAIEMTDWREWLGSEITEETLKNYPPRELIAHALWEMTFFGYENVDIKEKREELLSMVDRIKEGKEELRQLERDDEGNLIWEPVEDED
jgi:hypothetical protein